ncbi:MAG: aspartate dehydrogenase [Candidatus Micrarchaeota archaeon]|nr:aspartate dehydrogenase [Candidatus Micrarchaeota archaeon]
MRIGLIGLGNIGSFLAMRLKKQLVWVLDSDPKAKKRMERLGLRCPFYSKMPERCGGAELVVEAASQQAVPMLFGCLEHCDVMVMSVGALADQKLLELLKRKARKHRRKIYIPSGAIGGLDAISAARKAGLRVVLETSKPPAAFGRMDARRVVLFEGSAQEACRLYPKNVNVSAAISIAGAGFRKTKVRIISDPCAKRNTHKIIASSSAGAMEMAFENVPFRQNPKTSMLAALSALNRIKKIEEEIQIG